MPVVTSRNLFPGRQAQRWINELPRPAPVAAQSSPVVDIEGARDAEKTSD
jgi:hypothetical protein